MMDDTTLNDDEITSGADGEELPGTGDADGDDMDGDTADDSDGDGDADADDA